MLYDKLQKGNLILEDDKNMYLVDFKHKDSQEASTSFAKPTEICVPVPEEDDISFAEDDDSEWFVLC